VEKTFVIMYKENYEISRFEQTAFVFMYLVTASAYDHNRNKPFQLLFSLWVRVIVNLIWPALSQFHLKVFIIETCVWLSYGDVICSLKIFFVIRY